jgi:hypothetical protein
MHCNIEPISPPSSPIYEIIPVSNPSSPILVPISPPSSPILVPISPPSSLSSHLYPDKEFTSEFTAEWFDKSSKEWRKNKIFSKTKQLAYYKTNSDSPFTLQDYKTKCIGKEKLSIYPNAENWSKCGYIASNGIKCTNQGIFYDDELKDNPEYDYEKFDDIHLCENHINYLKKEQHKRNLIIECALLERQVKLYNKLDKQEQQEQLHKHPKKIKNKK